MKKRFKKEELSSPHLRFLQKDLEKISKAEDYLEQEFKKLKKEREKVRKKIKKEREILRLKNKINFLKRRK
jgi:hypothetical protein